MIITLLYQNTANTILFSSVTSFNESYNASVTSHPIESGKSVSDNITTENAKFQLSGVISDFDYFNPVKELAYGVSDNYDDTLLNKFNLASFVNGKFVTPSVELPSEVTSAYIKETLKQAREDGSLFSIFIYDDNNRLEKHYPNCALTSLSFKKDNDTEFCIYPEMSFEQLNLVDVLVETIEKGKIPDLPTQSKMAAQGDKGKVDDCLGPMKVDNAGNITKDTSKQKVAKGQRPRPKCEPDKAKTSGLTLEQLKSNQLRELQDAQIQVTLAKEALGEARELRLPSLIQQRQKDFHAKVLYAEVTLPQMQSETLAKKKAEESGAGR